MRVLLLQRLHIISVIECGREGLFYSKHSGFLRQIRLIFNYYEIRFTLFWFKLISIAP